MLNMTATNHVGHILQAIEKMIPETWNVHMDALGRDGSGPELVEIWLPGYPAEIVPKGITLNIRRDNVWYVEDHQGMPTRKLGGTKLGTFEEALTFVVKTLS